MPSRARRTLFSLVIFFATCGLIGMMIDQKVGAQSSTDESTFRDNLRSSPMSMTWSRRIMPTR